MRRQDVRHAGGVVDVHLAAVGLDEELFGQIRRLTPLAGSSGRSSACERLQSRSRSLMARSPSIKPGTRGAPFTVVEPTTRACAVKIGRASCRERVCQYV